MVYKSQTYLSLFSVFFYTVNTDILISVGFTFYQTMRSFYVVSVTCNIKRWYEYYSWAWKKEKEEWSDKVCDHHFIFVLAFDQKLLSWYYLLRVVHSLAYFQYTLLRTFASWQWYPQWQIKLQNLGCTAWMNNWS